MSTTGNNAITAVKKFRSWMVWMILIIGGVVVLGILTYQMATYKAKPHNSPSQSSSQSSEIPLTSGSMSARPKLSMPAGGETKKIPVPVGMHVVMYGDDFRYHCVYRDGHEESFGKGEASCPDGDMPFVYATNNRKSEENVISYAYANQGEK